MVVITVITTTLERKPVTGSQRKTVSAVHRFFVHGTTPRALISLILSLPASRKKSFPVK